MPEIQIRLEEIPHGHGLSFKKGIADGLLGTQENKASCHSTHYASYERGYKCGEELVAKIAPHVKA